MKIDQREVLLDDWEKLNNFLRACNEQEAKELLDHERAMKNRMTTVMRVYTRYSRCRRRREHQELVG